MNAHSLPFTNETLKKAAESSLRNKPIVGKYNSYRKDMMGHEKDEVIIGFIPQVQEFEYIENKDGNTELHAYAILWKHYNYDIYEMFKQKKMKSVSMEIKVNDMEQGWEGDEDIEQIKNFSFLGVCVLGDNRTPASAGAYINIKKFSSDEQAEKMKEMESKYMKYFAEDKKTIEIDNSEESAIDSKTWSNLGSKLFEPLLNATNWRTAVKEAYLIADIPSGAKAEDVSGSQDLSYPHHSLVDGNSKLVVNKKGIIAAHQRAAQQGIVSGDVLKHLKKHYRELGLRTENFIENQEEFSEKKLTEMELKEFSIEFSSNPDSQQEEDMTLKKDFEDLQKKFEDLEKNFEDAKKENESLKKENEEFAKADAKSKENAKADKKDEEKKVTESDEDFEAKAKEQDEKIAKYEEELETLKKEKEKTDVYMEEFEKLKEEKKDFQKREMETKVAETFELVSDTLPQEEVKIFEDRFSSGEVTFENCEFFCNEIKAKTLEFSIPKKQQTQQKSFSLSNVGDEDKTVARFSSGDWAQI